MSRACAVAIVCALAGAATPARTAPGTASENGAPPAAAAVRLETAPELDGRVLDDPVWRAIAPLGDFWQTTPEAGQPASEATEVRVACTGDALWFGVVCRDREPGRIVRSEGRRDGSLDEVDCFRIVLDTYLDGQNGFVFATNPAGMEYDGQVTNEGQGSGSGAGFNINWDGSWDVRTQTGEFGWSAEFRIPFRTLRFAPTPSQSWGLNMQRNIRKRNETAFWAPLPRQAELYRVSQAGRLTDIAIPVQRNLKVTPYVLGRASRDGSGGHPSDFDSEAGGDLKYGVTPALTLDATVNTDFAQVEVDEQQVNLDRFNLFFPEKRPFFLENAGLFAFGTATEVDAFFSRRIGLAPDGSTVPIVAGARLSGNARGWSMGLLDMQTEAVDGVAPANNFAVARLRRDLPRRSAVGGIAVQRFGTGSQAPEDDWSHTLGLDGRLGFGRDGSLGAWVAGTTSPGSGGRQHAYNVALRNDSEAWRLEAGYTEVGAAFDPQVGFLRRRGYRKPEALVFYRRRPHDFLGLHEVRPHASYRGYWDFDGFQESGFLHVDNHWEWRNGWEFHTGVNFTREGVSEPFEIFPGVVVPRGTYDHREAQLVLITNEAARWSYRITSYVGGFFGGDRVSLQHTARWRAGDRFQAELGWNRNDIDLPAGSFVTNIGRARLSYSFTPRLFLQSLFQVNDRADVLSTNLRAGWLRSASTGLYAVYNETTDTGGASWRSHDRAFILKYSRMLDLLD